MAIEAKEIIAHIRKGLMYSIRISFKSACDHPFVFGMVFFLLIMYRCFPSLFAFLVSSSPVIICTTLLLGILLSYGEPNLPEIEEDKKTQEFSSLKVGNAASNLVVRKDESFTVEAHVESRNDVSERTVEEAALGERRATFAVPFTRVHDDGDERGDTFMAASSSVEEDDKEIHSEEKLTEEKKGGNQGFFENREFSVEKQAEGALNIVEDVCGVSTKEQEDKVDIDKLTLENHIDSSLGSSWQPSDSHDVSSDSESDSAESSSPDASMTDIIPMLDELHPLLDTEPQPALKSMDNSDASSGVSSQDQESDDGSAVEAGEHQDDEEAQEEKDDGDEEAVKWTADDQKNLMDLGTSEMERNQRLENLIAKRRARKNLRFDTEKNLIDLDSNDSAPTVEDLSHFLSQIPPISATRRNPFDIPYDSEGTIGLPPIPGSAPSVLLPRRNPFDIPYDQVDQSGSLMPESLNHQEFVSAPQRDIFFRRHESFSLGASVSGELKQEKSDIRLKPYFVTERAEDTGFASLQRQLSGKSNSKVSSVPESDIASPIIDQEHHKQLLEKGLHGESELLSPANHDAEPIEPGSQSSEEVDTFDVDHEQSGITVGDDSETDLNTSIATFETHQAADSFRAVEEEIIEAEYDSLISDAANLEVIEDKYGESSSSSSSEVNEKSSILSTHEESVNLEPTTGDSSKVSSDSMHLLPADSRLLSRAGQRVDDSQVADPVYDSSPSAVGIPHDEDLFYSGKRGSNSSSSTIDMADISELVSPPKPLEKNISSGGDSEAVNEDLVFASGGIWVASPNLSSVDKNESRSREITEIREHDVIQAGLSEISEDFVKPVALAMPRLVAGRIMHTESSDDSPIDMDASFQSERDEITDAATSSSDSLVLSDHLTSSALEKAHPSVEKFAFQPSSEAGLEESRINMLKLPSISEENIEDFKLEEETQSMIHPAGDVGLTGVEMIKESDVGLSDIEQELSSFQRKSPEGVEKIDSTQRLVHDPENDDASDVSPVTSSLDGGFTGLRLFEPTESPESDVGSSLHPSGVDPEIAVYNTKLHVIEACSSDELDSALKQIHEEAVMPSVSEPIVEKLATAKAEDGSSECDSIDRDPKLTETESELQVSEAKSMDDFNSGLQVVEAKSPEDINSASAENPQKPMAPKDGSVVVEASGRHLEPEVLEVQSGEEIHLVSAEAVASETGSSHGGPGDEISHGSETAAVVSSASASTSRKIRKKDKHGKSGSSLSSSSSDSE